jgi:ABC-type glycerol-3-phosphate transport system substrate-binding protein
MKRKASIFMLTICMLLTCTASFQPQTLQASASNDTKSMLDNLFKKNSDKSDQETEPNGQTEADKKNEHAMNQKVTEDYYTQVIQKWEKEGYSDAKSFQTVIHPNQLNAGSNRALLTPISESQGYDEEVVLSNELTPEINFTVNVPSDGLYQIQIDYLALPGKITPVERGIQINNEYPYFETRRIVLPRLWTNESDQFQKDELGNEVFSKQVEVSDWQSAHITDASYLYDEPLKFYFKKGNNNIKLLHIREKMLIGRISVTSPEVQTSYEEYLKSNPTAPDQMKVIETYEAEKPYVKSDSYIQAMASADINVSPNRKSLISLNTVGGDSWNQGGQSVSWKINVEQSGYYSLAFKYTQLTKTNMPVFRKILIDGKVPFQEAAVYSFPYASDWENEVLSNAKGEPFKFYLTEGEHDLTMIANPSPYQPVIQTVREVMEELNALSLEIKMATGNTLDVYRDWDITEQMPNISEKLNEIAAKMRNEYNYLRDLSGRNPDEARNLMIGAKQLERLALEPSTIPVRFDEISQGSGSVTQKLGDMMLTLPKQPIQIDKFYVYAGEKLPKAKAVWWKKISSVGQNFYTSFTKDYTQISPADEDSLQIWVNRPRQYVMLMQQMADQQFTAKTGIKVSFSLMPNEQKLILASASGNSPDAALGVNEKTPYEFALRGALTDLSQYEDYKQIVGRFSPGAMLPFMFDGGVYALPETQNFWVLYYRKDILDALKLEVPQTWEDVLQTLPTLQRYGMNFYVPLAESGAMKSFNLTTPFFYQQGGELFSEDGTKSVVDSDEALEGFKMMTKIFTVYNMPLQIPNFYNHFRDGNLPIGISNYNTYVELTTAAPELSGSWKIAPYPGIANDKGGITRWAPGTGQGVVVFKDSDKQQQAWEFIKWWTSAEIQAEFGNLIETIYGPTYRWNSANLEAFGQLPWPEEDLKVIQEQWKWL